MLRYLKIAVILTLFPMILIGTFIYQLIVVLMKPFIRKTEGGWRNK